MAALLIEYEAACLESMGRPMIEEMITIFPRLSLPSSGS
jgi:hypothetical protein